MSTEPGHTSEPPIEASISPQEKTWAMLCHISGFASQLGVIPFASVIGPLVVWLLKKDMSPFVEEHGRESVNFQITVSILYAISFVLLFFIIGFFLMPLVILWWVVLTIVAAIKASNGERFRYPLTIRFVR